MFARLLICLSVSTESGTWDHNLMYLSILSSLWLDCLSNGQTLNKSEVNNILQIPSSTSSFCFPALKEKNNSLIWETLKASLAKPSLSCCQNLRAILARAIPSRASKAYYSDGHFSSFRKVTVSRWSSKKLWSASFLIRWFSKYFQERMYLRLQPFVSSSKNPSDMRLLSTSVKGTKRLRLIRSIVHYILLLNITTTFSIRCLSSLLPESLEIKARFLPILWWSST